MKEKTKEQTAVWARGMRKKYRLGLLKPSEIRMLDEIGFDYEKVNLVKKSSQLKKDELLNMARRGDPMPERGQHPLGDSFYCYTFIGGARYDKNFHEEIKTVRPGWVAIKRKFVYKNNINHPMLISSNTNKKLLLEMAGREDNIHFANDKLRNSFRKYTSNKHVSYDMEFDEEIRRIAPAYWFKRKERVGSQVKVVI